MLHGEISNPPSPLGGRVAAPGEAPGPPIPRPDSPQAGPSGVKRPHVSDSTSSIPKQRRQSLDAIQPGPSGSGLSGSGLGPSGSGLSGSGPGPSGSGPSGSGPSGSGLISGAGPSGSGLSGVAGPSGSGVAGPSRSGISGPGPSGSGFQQQRVQHGYPQRSGLSFMALAASAIASSRYDFFSFFVKIYCELGD